MSFEVRQAGPRVLIETGALFNIEEFTVAQKEFKIFLVIRKLRLISADSTITVRALLNLRSFSAI